MTIQEKLEEMLIRLLSEHDHEPDEITKYFVIDRADFVPEATEAILDIISKYVIGEDEAVSDNAWNDLWQAYDRCKYNALRESQREKLR